MKLRLTKHKLTLEDFTKETFSSIDYGTIEARLLHTQYNDILQYYFIKLLFDAVESSRSACDCKSRLTDKFVLEQCDTQCEQIPNKDLFNKYIEDNLETYLNFVYKKFDEWLEFKRHNCNNDCETYIPLDFADLKYPIMDCLHDNSVISDFLEFNTIEELKAHILKITDYLDDLTAEQDATIEALEYFDYIQVFNEINRDQWPVKIDLKGFRTYYDGAEGEFYLQDEDVVNYNVPQDYGIINDFKGLRYKRVYTGEVNADWFGVKYFNEHTSIFLYLLTYDNVNLHDRTYNINLPMVAERTISNSIWWRGQNASVNIKVLNEQDSALKFILTRDIYEIKIEGLRINVGSEHTIPNFIEMNDDFKVDIFLFDSTLSTQLGVEKNEYLTDSFETIKSDVFWSTLPLVPTITNADNEGQLLNLAYIGQIKETSVDGVLTTNTMQNVEVTYNLENSFKVTVESSYGNNTKPLLKKYVSESYLHGVASGYINGIKSSISTQMSVTRPNTFNMANTVDNGFINQNLKGNNNNWGSAGSGDTCQDFNRKLFLPLYANNLKFVQKLNIFNLQKTAANTKPVRKCIPTRWYQYNGSYASNFENDLFMPTSNTYGAKLTSKSKYDIAPGYYLIYVRCNQDYTMDVGNFFLDTYWNDQDISWQGILYQLLSAPRAALSRTMKGYKNNVYTNGYISFIFNLAYYGNGLNYWLETRYIQDFSTLWTKKTEEFNFIYKTMNGSNVRKQYRNGRSQIFKVAIDNMIGINYSGESTPVRYRTFKRFAVTHNMFSQNYSTYDYLNGYTPLYLRFTDPYAIVAQMNKLTTVNQKSSAFNATMYNMSTNGNITLSNIVLTYVGTISRREDQIWSDNPKTPYSVFRTSTPSSSNDTFTITELYLEVN